MADKNVVGAGRRAGAAAAAATAPEAGSSGGAPLAGRRAGGTTDAPAAATGWAESSSAAHHAFKRPAAATGTDESATKVGDEDADANARVWNRNRFSEDGAPIQEIADSDDDDAFIMSVASAPRNVTRKMQSLTELTAAAGMASAGAGGSKAVQGTDLSLLTAVLCAPEALVEADEAWDFDALLQSVAQAITAEKEQREGEDDKHAMAAST